MAVDVHPAGEMYVQVARGIRSTLRTLTLVDLAPSTIRLAQTPEVTVGYLPTGVFLDRWDALSATYAADPPAGTLSLLDPNAVDSQAVVLRLRHPRFDAMGLTYDVEVVSGVLPRASGACVLFIDPHLNAVPHVAK